MRALEGRVALVTGSSRGIGAAIARLFSVEGARVAVHGRDAAALDDVVRAICWEGGQAMAVTADVTRFSEIEAIRDDIEQCLGPVDVLVANAGGNPSPPAPLESITEDDWRAAVDANLTSTFLTLKAFLPGMKKRRRGTIITVSSAAARRPHPKSPIPYAAAKAGIQMLTQHLALEAGPFGIRVNGIAPATILTERNAERLPPTVQTSLASAHALQRLGVPDDMANAALFLASDASSWISGIILDVAGGGIAA